MKITLSLKSNGEFPVEAFIADMKNEFLYSEPFDNSHRLILDGDSIRGVAVTNEGNGRFSVFLPAYASTADRKLFVDVASWAQLKLKAKVFDYEDVPVRDVRGRFDKRWFSESRREDYEMLIQNINLCFEPACIPVLGGVACIGDLMLRSLGIPHSVKDLTEEHMDKLESFLLQLQWQIQDTTPCEMASLYVENDVAKRGDGPTSVTTSYICIRNGEVVPFDYIPYSRYIGFGDEDNDRYAIIPADSFYKILPQEYFAHLDDRQFQVLKPITPEVVYDLMNRCVNSIPYDLTHPLCLPGSTTYDEDQRAFLFMWDATSPSQFLEAEIGSFVPAMKIFTPEWRLGSPSQIDPEVEERMRPRDRFYVLRTDGERRGIVMAGLLDSYVYYNLTDDGQKELAVSMRPSMVTHPAVGPMLRLEGLKLTISTVDWDTKEPVIELDEIAVRTLDRIFIEFYYFCGMDVDCKTFYFAI